MPFSAGVFKKETLEYIKNNFSTSSKILDIGCGAGSYSDLLKPSGYSIDGIEGFEPYVDRFNLKLKYDNLYIVDSTKQPKEFFSKYDLIIMGDVFEHFSHIDALDILEKIGNIRTIIAVPYSGEQGAEFGNDFEIHRQTDLNPINFHSRFSGFFPYCVGYDYGVYINDPDLNFLYKEGHAQERWMNYVENNFVIDRQFTI